MQKGKKEDGACLARTRRHEFESSQEDQNTTNQPERTHPFYQMGGPSSRKNKI